MPTPVTLAKPRRTASNKWLELVNPIRNLSISEAKAIYDAARRFGSPRLHKIYDEIELTDPVLMTCVDRRQSALAGLGWQVKTRANADQTLAAEQRAAADEFLANVENLTDALCHLDLAYFRGFAHVQPIWESNAVRHIEILDNWNFLTDDDGNWLWNPNCAIVPSACEPITPAARLISVTRRRAIDWPALVIFIRKSLGERDWGRFIERYGIPPVDVVMAPQTTEEQEKKYLASAEDARDGLPTAWPANSVVSRAEGSRGQDPFTAFIEHQEKLIVLAATGGTLTSLAQADTGALAGGAQMDVWREIVLRDALVIADAVERSLVRPFVAAAFPGAPFAISFEMGVERKPTAAETADLAGKIRSAGYLVKRDELAAATGFTLEAETAAASLPFSLAKGKTSDVHLSPSPSPLLEAFDKDSKPLATAIQDLLKDLETADPAAARDRVNDFISNLNDLIPDDPATAAVIAEEMAKQFSSGPRPLADEPLANSGDQPRGKSSPESTPGSFAPAGGGEANVDKNPKASEAVKTFLKEVPKKISPEQADTILREGFTDHDGSGNDVHYGKILLDHINQDSHSPNDRDARKRSLGEAMKMIRETSPKKSDRPGGKENVYFGLVGGKAYIAVADENNEINAMEMISYRRDGRRDER